MPDPAEQPKEVLNQSEVDALLASLQEEETKAQGPEKAAASKKCQPYTFRSPSFLPPAKLRRVRIKHENFTVNLTHSLSQLLRLETVVRLSNMETITHKAMIEALSGPSHLTIFRLSPLPGMCLMEINTRLGLTLVGRMLGGKGQFIQEERNFTELELSVLNEVVDLILREYVASWQMPDQQVRANVVEHETSANYLRLAPDNTQAFFLTIEVKVVDNTSTIRLGFFYNTLEPLINKLTEDIPPEIEKSTSPGKAANLIALYESAADILIPIHARWEGMQISVRELTNLKKDDVLLMDPSTPGRTSIYLNTIQKFSGQTGRKGDHLAIRINSKLP
ncbi:MAG: FliM/FliN family flagellar motor switch protein [Verrucomicrobiae bacterium]|nr:FliM/FliN family flagellar motor switch protein [Verrucomicrobiae bacterium]